MRNIRNSDYKKFIFQVCLIYNILYRGICLAEVEIIEASNAETKIPRIEIIVDSSGSMAQSLNKEKTKMFFTKKMLTRYLTHQYKEKAEVGLRVYGSQRKGDCADSNLIIPFSSTSLGQIESKIEKLEPLGKTPLYKSVLAASQDLKSYDGPKKIIVFTDGEDTCGGNPCKEGKEATVDPSLHAQIYVVAIGFDQKSDDLRKVSCLGETSTADSEDELFEALGDIHQKIYKDQLNLYVESPDPTVEVQLYKWTNENWKWDRNFTAAFGAKVPPGKYQAIVQLDPPFKFDSFEVPPKKIVRLKVRGEGKFQVDFTSQILDVEFLDKNMKLIKKFKSDVSETIPMGRWSIRISKQPFFEKFLPKYDIAPNGDYHYKPLGVGAISIEHSQMQGVYVYDSKNNIIGNYLTNFPFALPIGSYKIHVDSACSFDNVGVSPILDGKYQTLKCNGSHSKKD